MRKIEYSCIIDDDPIFVYGTKRLMNEVNFCSEILVYSNGQEAIDGLKKLTEESKKLPSVIFLDLNMPIMNGWEFLEDFLKIPNPNRQEVTVFIMSSSIDPRDLERVKAYPLVNNYILKPITPQDLENVLDEVA